MNPLGEQVLQVAKQYLGPAAQQFLSKELRVLECTADTITAQHLPQLMLPRVQANRIRLTNQLLRQRPSSGNHDDPRRARWASCCTSGNDNLYDKC